MSLRPIPNMGPELQKVAKTATRFTCGCIGSVKLQIRIRDGVMIIFAALSILSSNVSFSATETATTPLMVGCHWISVIFFSLLNCRSVKDWYSWETDVYTDVRYHLYESNMWIVMDFKYTAKLVLAFTSSKLLLAFKGQHFMTANIHFNGKLVILTSHLNKKVMSTLSLDWLLKTSLTAC